MQGSRAHGPLGQERLALLLGCLLLCSQALQLLGCALGEEVRDVCSGQVGFTQPSCLSVWWVRARAQASDLGTVPALLVPMWMTWGRGA